MSDSTEELVFEASRGQAQFGYFLLGLAASAIAFAVHESEGRALVDTAWPIGLAVILWAVSFAVGCFGVNARHQGLIVNARLNFMERDARTLQLHSDPEVQATIKRVKKETQLALDRPVNRFRWQLWMLFAGATAYIAGDIMQMSAIPSTRGKTQVAHSSPAHPVPASAARSAPK